MSLRTAAVAAVVSAASLALVAGAPESLADQPSKSGPGAADKGGGNLITGMISAVTVYRGQALVTRSIDVPGGAGLREIVVTDLPEAIIPGSLYAESADGVEVRSVSYRIRPIGEDTRESVRAAEKAVRDAHDAVEAAKAKQQYMDWQRQYLDKLEGFVAPTAQTDLKNGVLNAETLSKLTDLITTRRKAQSEDGQKLAIEVRTLTETLQLKERELAVLTASSSRTAREAVVFVNASKAGSRVRLSYLVNGANWAPSYNLRITDPKSDKAVLEYQASVQQMSGEDWNGVSLTLSTATPALVATGPSLHPLSVTLAAPQQAQQALAMFKDKSYEEAKKSLNAQLRDVERNRSIQGNDNNIFYANAAGRASGGGGGGKAGEPSMNASQFAADTDGTAVVLSLDSGLNEIACQSELLDLVSTTKVERKGKGEPVTVRQGDEGVSVTYKLASQTSMPSRADQQLIQIAQLELPAKVARAATPTLTQYIYNEAEVTNTSSMVLLAGPAASYLAGEFVGSSGVPTVAAGESFRTGFGIDSSLRAGKELVERSEKTEGGNRIIEFTYKLTIENFGQNPAPVRLLDRLPSPKGGIGSGEVKVVGPDSKVPLSADPDYLETDRKKNILRWDVTVPPGQTGTKAFTVEYKFSVQFDKNMALTEGK